ncbi:MAG: hypothetical protein Q4C56_02550 [Peptococcaceae bacterium]|nr:hypothetical protein [Peptococcaceae bacterium]
MSQQATKKSKLFYLHVFITVVLMFGFGYLPPFGSITSFGMRMIGVFLGLIYAWTTTSLLWPSFLGMLAIVFSGAYSMSEFAAISFGNETVVFMILIMVFTGALDKAGLVKFLSSWIISRKAIEGRPWMFTLALLFGAYLGGMLINAFASVIFFWRILYTVCDEFGFKKYDKYPSLMVFGIVFASMTAGLTALPYHLTALIVIGAVESAAHMSIPFVSYVLFTIPMSALLIFVYYLIMWYLFRLDLSRLKDINIDFIDKKDLILNKTQKLAIFFTFLMITLLMSVDILKLLLPDTAIANLMGGWGIIGVVLLLIVLGLVIQVDGQSFMHYQESIKSVDWSMIYLFAIILPFSSILTSDATGVSAWLVETLTPLFIGKSFLAFAVIILLLGTIITNFANNSVILVIFINICTPICASMDIPLLPLVMCMLFCYQLAYMTPAASAPAAFVFGNTTWIKASAMYKPIFITLVIMFIVCVAVGLPFGNLIFG